MKVLNADQQDRDQLITVAKALGSEQRLRILDYLQTRAANVSEIAEALAMPLSTANLHLNLLAEAGLIYTETVSARRGIQKLCARSFDVIVLHLPLDQTQQRPTHESIQLSMPVGAFVSQAVLAPCGLAGAERLIGLMDDPAAFYEPERYNAQLVWFGGHGFLEYRFPYYPTPGKTPGSFQLSMEICSEAAPHHQAWPSDIFVEVNGVMLGAWTSPADFGGERGTLTPAWWGEWNSQYGLLKTWRVDQEGAFIDGQFLSKVVIGDLRLDQQPFIQVRVGVKPDAAHVGGLNLFGREFGNHAQDMTLRLSF
jgi:predicted transcriptional regulator